ncbi:MAG: fumarylacetoacetate hydrolase family protein [Ectothiorhodospiraceae bacterium]|nr:fumarylacetoacetate hydrolase family protein [Ectothiorhodospiraceae bacterium]
MPNTADLSSVADRLRSAQDEARQIQPPSATNPGFDLPDAYRVAGLIHEQRLSQGWRSLGRKIGLTNRAAWERLGVNQPMWAHVYDRTVVRLNSAQAVFSLARLVRPRIEPEVVVHLHDAPPPGGSAEDVYRCIDWIAPAFEIVQSHYPPGSFGVPDTVADSGFHGALLVGEPQAVGSLDELPAALGAFAVELFRNGEHRETGTGENVLGSPLRAAAELLTVLATQGEAEPLRAGELITTGTITTAHDVQPGERWQATFHGLTLPAIEVTFGS